MKKRQSTKYKTGWILFRAMFVSHSAGKKLLRASHHVGRISTSIRRCLSRYLTLSTPRVNNVKSLFTNFIYLFKPRVLKNPSVKCEGWRKNWMNSKPREWNKVEGEGKKRHFVLKMVFKYFLKQTVFRLAFPSLKFFQTLWM